jgi:hypothetical protein
MRHEGGIEANEPIAVVEIGEGQAVLQYQISHSRPSRRRKNGAYFLIFPGESREYP